MTDHFHHVWLSSDVDKVASAPVAIFEDMLEFHLLHGYHGIVEVEMGYSVCFCHGVVVLTKLQCCCRWMVV